jgi:RimJ/RimL family protein N-acetyltransferase
METMDAGPVLLRPFRLDDVDDIAMACSDPVSQRYLPMMPSPYTRQDALRFVSEQVPAGWQAGGAHFAIADRATGRLIGSVGIARVIEGSGDIGYWVAPWGRRRGAATAATIELTRWAFGRGFTRLSLRTEPDNGPSQRVAIAAGYLREGVMRGGSLTRDGRRRDLVLWARLHDDPPGPSPRLLPDLPEGGLTDAVVRLRPVDAGDAEEVYRLRVRPEVVATSVPPLPPDRAQVEAQCAGAVGDWLAGARATLVIEDAASRAFAGEIGLYYAEPVTGQAMIGYDVVPAWRGRGYARRAVRLLCGWAFAEVGVARLIAGTAPDNVASQRVLEAAGFRREGYQRSRLPAAGGGRLDDVLYALLPGD